MRINKSGEILTFMAVMMVVMIGAGLLFHKNMGMCGMGHEQHEHNAVQASPLAEKTYAKDPVCGMAVEISSNAVQSNWNNKDYFFCSKEDRGKFELNPEKYSK